MTIGASRRARFAAVLAIAGTFGLIAMTAARPATTAAERPETELANEPAPSAERIDANRGRRAALESNDGLSAEERALLDGLLARLRGPFEEPRLKLAFLERLLRELEARYPETYLTELERIVRAAFPGEADALLALVRNRNGFEGYLREHRVELARMRGPERRAATWDARRRFFGADADRIFASVARNEAIEATLESIDADPAGPVGDRFGRYMTAIEEGYGPDATRYLADRRQEVLDRFVALDSVQADLAAMTPAARGEALRDIRAQSGMDEEALGRWDSLDRVRDERRDVGATYMQERAALERTLDGDALTNAIGELRMSTFGDEAETIANEEAGGYFRFEASRTFGMN